MKKGKTSKLEGFKDSKIVYGTVDSKELKSIYVNLQTWVEPKYEMENWTSVVSNMSRSIKHSVYDSIDNSIFDKKYIVDMDLRTSGLNINKKSFMNLEMNFFINTQIDFKSKELKKSVKSIISSIYRDIIYKNNYFNFFLTKSGHQNSKKVEFQSV